MLKNFIKYISASLIGLSFLWSATYVVVQNDTLNVEAGDEIQTILQERLLQLGDSGFPFSEFSLDQYVKNDGNDYLIYRGNRQEHVKIDTVVFGDYTDREIRLLSHYIAFPDTGDFNYTQVRKTINHLKTLDWLKVEDKADIRENGLRLYTSAKQDVRFDAVAAYKQGSDKSGVVGHVVCDVNNLLGLGRKASFSWSNPDLDISEILIAYKEPYIFNKPFSISGDYSQRYEDSSYVKRDLNLSMIYHMTLESNLHISYRNEQITRRDTTQSSGYLKESRYGSIVLLNMSNSWKTFSLITDITAGVISETDNIISTLDGKAELTWRPARVGVNFSLLGALVSSKDALEDYDKIKLGGAEFLRGSYFEQYECERYLGWQLEAGLFTTGLSLYAFYDGAYLDELIHQAGIAIRLPAGKNFITIGVGGDLNANIGDAKFYVIWDM